MSKPKILVQLDSDQHASVFDAVVAIDSGVDHLLRHQSVTSDHVRDLVHGAMFTRGPKDLHQTAVFVGGRDVAAGEQLLRDVTDAFFGPMRVSVMLDANGANTTAAAAVLAAAKHYDLQGAVVTVLGGTGPVGQRAALLAAGQGATVRLASRRLPRATTACEQIRSRLPEAKVQPVVTGDESSTVEATRDAHVLIAAGAAGAQLLSAENLRACDSLRVAIDLNAVPPTGIEGVGVTATAEQQGDVVCYGAIGVGGSKMKIHKACIKKLFEANDLVLDAEEIYAIGQQL